MFEEYDLIVVGAGHAGCEAAHAAAKMGSKVLLITMNMQTIAQMSCNPAMGGVAKGQIVREIDALGGMSGIISDLSMIQFRMLNRSKGPAMHSPRTQNDRELFAKYWRQTLEKTPNLDFWQEMVEGLWLEGENLKGVITSSGSKIPAKTVVLTSGTFLNGTIHIGEKQFGGGRAGEKAAKGITEQLLSLGFEAGRMKTGTPPRVDGRSLDFSKMEVQEGDKEPSGFSFLDTSKPRTQKNCWITYTNPKVHDLLREGFDRSPMFNGSIKSIGPRYCPSIEDKINRFADRDRHQIFVEPEGWETVEIYVNGFSTSLPQEIQQKAIREIPGFENAKLFRPGYAIEYDYFPPLQLDNSLQTKSIHGLFFAGQINGTTGYEEAACQGLMAGINAHRLCQEQEPVSLSRDQAYIGVLIDDLINKGTDEPYRMFTSRAEHRMLLRQDNADLRLTPMGHHWGLASDERLQRSENKKQNTQSILETLSKLSAEPQSINPLLEKLESQPLTQKVKMNSVLNRPNIHIAELMTAQENLGSSLQAYSQEELLQAEIQLKYASYIEKEMEQVEKVQKLEDFLFQTDFDFDQIKSLSNEAREKLKKVKPKTLGQASRISGISPADISVLMVYLGR